MQRLFSLLSFILLVSFESQAQTLPYQYAYWQGEFTPLENATIIPATAWDEDIYPIVLDFPFKLNGQTYSTLEFVGYEGGIFQNYGLSNGPTAQAILGYNTYDGLEKKVGTVVSYKTEGAAPNRIFKIEWLKAGFFSQPGTVSFQIWLFETSNTIQVHLGPQDVPDPESTFFNEVSPLVGLVVDLSYDANDLPFLKYGHFVQGDFEIPTDTVLNNWTLPFNDDAPLFGCNGVPLENAVFTFTPGNVAGTAQPEVAELAFFPNPAVEKISFHTATGVECVLQVFDLQGKTIHKTILPAGSISWEIPAALPTGNYVLQLAGNGQILSGKLAVQR